MNEMHENQRPETLAVPASTPKAPARPAWEVGGRERALLLLCLGLGLLAADLLLSVGNNWLGLGVPAGTAAWYAVLLWYVGPKRLAETRSRLFFAAILLLALTFPLFSNGWLRFWNLGFLLALLTIHAFQLSGAPSRPWYVPSMLWERFRLLMDGLFGRLGALGAVLNGLRSASARRGVMAALGALITLPLVLVAAGLLSRADLLFERLASGVLEFICQHLDLAAAKVVLGLLAAPFLFSLLYALGRPRPLMEKKNAGCGMELDRVVPVMVLAGLDALYLLFAGVQSAALFGGPAYLERMGISYAEYARTGFFQLAFITALNLTVLLVLLQWTRRQGRGWRLIQVLSYLLAALSGVILVSAVWRMTLYVAAYGLSVKRALTYWGMAMMALLLAAACRKVARAEFRFFRFAAVAVLAGWLVLNYMSVDSLTARYNVARFQAGQLETVDLNYLSNLPYEALPALEGMDGSIPLNEWAEFTLEQRLTDRRAQAAAECGRWETWSLPAWLAARRQ